MLKIEMVGKQFGRLTVVSESGTYRGSYCWLCRCDCGEERIVWGNNLRRGNTQSCGCAAVEHVSKLNATHRKSGTTAYRSWKAMRQRCGNPRRPDWGRYGGRGITVCERWNVFENFLADMGECPPGASLDRIDNDLGYSPENCRWADSLQQQRNRRKSLVIEFQGKSLHLKEWSRLVGLSYTLLQQRLRKGWAVERALTEPVRQSR